jgi:glycosyltransferase involved in cell wall biosynthesis
LLEGFAAIKDAIPHDLLLIGPCGWSSSDIPRAIERLGISKRVRFMGFVDRQELPAAYSLASVFVYISLYEGFGLPPLEAMSCGCPVIASNVTSLPEVVGEAARMVNPHAVQEVSASLLEIIANPSLKASLVDKGLMRAKLFSWAKCAETTINVYRQVIDRHGRSIADRPPGMQKASENKR